MSAVGRMVMIYFLLFVLLVVVLGPFIMISLPFFVYIVPFMLICVVIIALADWVRHWVHHRATPGTH